MKDKLFAIIGLTALVSFTCFPLILWAAIILDGLVMAAGKSKVRLFRKGEMK